MTDAKLKRIKEQYQEYKENVCKRTHTSTAAVIESIPVLMAAVRRLKRKNKELEKWQDNQIINSLYSMH